MGRLGNRTIIITEENQKDADEWMRYIGTVYQEYLTLFCSMEPGKDDEVIEKLDTTIVNCYDSIRRNGMKDKTEQGMKNYLFRSYQTNKWALQANDKYLKRRELMDNTTFIRKHDAFDEDDTDELVLKQLYDDFRAVYLVTLVEENCDPIDCFCWRVKHFIPKCTYTNVGKITKVRNAKTRVIRVNKWLKDNVKPAVVKRAFNSYCNDGIVRTLMTKNNQTNEEQ